MKDGFWSVASIIERVKYALCQMTFLMVINAHIYPSY